ncbi:MAG: hypothetical protein E7359_01380 [Clostridiales bacterium]|nr:hypothetical protein [Clostridiales bacterium]
MESTISLIVTGIILLIITVCILNGIIQGFKSSLVNGLINLTIVIIALILTGSIANFILDFDLTSYNIVVNGEQITTINQYILDLLQSEPTIADIIGNNPEAVELVVKLPLMIASPIIFTLLFWICKLIAFVISLIVKLILLIIKPFRNKKKQFNANGKPVKKKKHRLVGALIGAVSGLIIIFATFTPIFGVGNIFIQLNKIKTDENGIPVTSNTLVLHADDLPNETLSSTLLSDLIGTDCTPYINAYNNCIGINFARITGIEGLSTLTFNNLASAKVNKTEIKLVDEVNSIVTVYTDYLTLNNYLRKETLTKEEMTKVLDTTKTLVHNVFEVKTLNAVGNYILPKVIEGILDDPDYSIKLPESITEEEAINLITTSALRSLKNHDFSNVKNILLDLVSTLEIVNNNNILTPVYNSISTGEELSTEDYFVLIKSSNDTFSTDISDKLTSISLINDISPSLIDGGLDALFTFLKIDYSTNNITKEKAQTVLSTILSNAIDGIKTLDINSDLYLDETTFNYIGNILSLTKDNEVLSTTQYNDLTESVQSLLNMLELPFNIDSAIENLDKVTNWNDEMTKFSVAFTDFELVYKTELKGKSQLDITKLNLTNIGKLFDDLEKTTIFGGVIKDTYNDILNTTKNTSGMATFSRVLDTLKITETNISWEKELTALKPLLDKIMTVKNLELTDARSSLELLDIVAKFDTVEQDTNSVIYSAKMQPLLIEVLNSAKQIADNQTITDLVEKVHARINKRDTINNETLETCTIKGIFDYSATLIPDSENFENNNIKAMINEIKTNIIKANNGEIENFDYRVELEYLLDFADNVTTLQNFDNLSSEEIKALSNILETLNESKILGNCKTHIINYAFDLAISAITDDDLNIVDELNSLKQSLTNIDIKTLVDDMNTVKNNVNNLVGVTDDVSTMDTTTVSNALETIRNTETFTDEFTNNIVKNLLSNVNESAQANELLPSDKKTEIQNYVIANSNSLDNNETTSTTYKTILDGLKNLFTL